MKRLSAIFFLAITFFVSACRDSEKEVVTKPDEPDGTDSIEWIIYNTANSRLPDNQVNTLAIDKKDVKWAGTAKGLVRIAGEEWSIFNTANSPLPSEYISALTVEENGTVWIGTDKGLARFDGKNWSVYTSKNSVLTNDNVTCITHDPKHGITWIGTDEGLIKTDKNNNWEHIDVGDNVLLSLVADQNGAVWVGVFKPFIFRGQINKYENGRWILHHLHDLGYTSAFPYGLAVDKNNAVLGVLAGTTVKAVVRISNNGLTEITRPDRARGLKTILLEDDKIWVGGACLSIFGSKSAECLTIPGQETHILTMALDNKGRKWMGTIFGGIAGYKSKIKQ